MMDTHIISPQSACNCGSEHCQPRILQRILSNYELPNSGSSLAFVPPEARFPDRDSMDKDCQMVRSGVYSPAGSTGSYYESPRDSPASSPSPSLSPAASPAAVNTTDSKLFRILNGQVPGATSRRSPALHTGAARGYPSRAVPSPGAASTCSVSSDTSLYPPSIHDVASSPAPALAPEQQPLNLKRSHPQYSPSPSALDDPNLDQPMDLSCKKRRLSVSSSSSIESGFSYASVKRETLSPYPGAEDSQGNDSSDSSILKSILCGQRRSSRMPPQNVPSQFSLPPSPLSQNSSTSSLHGSGSSNILSGLLNHARFQGVMDSPAGSRCSTPESTGTPSISSRHSQQNNTNTVVALAKKNLFPVTARVSDWLVKIVHFSKSQPEFVNLPHSDQISLVLHSWSRVLLLYMAENSFHFAVTPKQVPSSGDESGDLSGSPDPDIPTMKGAESLQRFITKCQNLNLDQQEYSYLKVITLFNPGKFEQRIDPRDGEPMVLHNAYA